MELFAKVQHVMICLGLLISFYANAEGQQPLWEWRLAGGSVYLPDYPGSDEYRTRSIVLPYFVYRGEVLRVGDEGLVKGVLVDNEWIELDLSFSGAFNANSKGNRARQGMPDLDYLAEIGPQVIVKLAKGLNEKLDLRLPVRAVFSSDFGSVTHRGWVFNPRLRYEKKGWIDPSLKLTISMNSQITSREVQGYFYDVTPEYVTTERSEYRAKEGYFSSGASAFVSVDVGDRMRLFSGFGVTHYGGSANEKSELLEAETTGSFGLGLQWTFYKSQSKSI